jgi:aminocarboxymuconate-semialdehyde decarboxylase
LIDLHAHVVLEGVLGRAGPYGPELIDDPACPTFRVGGYTLEGVRYRNSAFMDLSLRLEQMEEMGIDWQLLSPNPLTYLHNIEAPVAAEFARWHNDEMAALVSRAPDRLGGAAQLPMQDPSLAAAELRRAVHELGLLAAYVGTDFGRSVQRGAVGKGGHEGVREESGHEESGVETVLTLDHPRMDEFWATAVELDVPVFLHPAPPGIDSPLADPRLRRFDADLWLAFAHEETLALATLVFGGVLERHEGLDICVSHGGGALVALIGKLRALAGRPWVPQHLRAPGAIDRSLQMLHYDAHVSDAGVRSALEAIVSEDRLVGGTNFAGWDQPAELPEPSVRARLDANARRLLRLDP